MKINKIDHVSLAVRELDGARKIWEPIMGKSGPGDSYIDEIEKIRGARYRFGGTPMVLWRTG